MSQIEKDPIPQTVIDQIDNALSHPKKPDFRRDLSWTMLNRDVWEHSTFPWEIENQDTTGWSVRLNYVDANWGSKALRIHINKTEWSTPSDENTGAFTTRPLDSALLHLGEDQTTTLRKRDSLLTDELIATILKDFHGYLGRVGADFTPPQVRIRTAQEYVEWQDNNNDQHLIRSMLSLLMAQGSIAAIDVDEERTIAELLITKQPVAPEACFISLGLPDTEDAHHPGAFLYQQLAQKNKEGIKRQPAILVHIPLGLLIGEQDTPAEVYKKIWSNRDVLLTLQDTALAFSFRNFHYILSGLGNGEKMDLRLRTADGTDTALASDGIKLFLHALQHVMLEA